MAPFLNLCLCFTLLITTTLCMFDIRAAPTQTRGAITSFSRRQLDPLLPSVDNDLSELTESIQSDVAPIQGLINPIVTSAGNLVDGVVTPVAGVVSPIASVVSPIETNAGNVVDGVVTPVAGVVSPIASVVSPIETNAGNLVDGVVTPIAGVVGPVVTDAGNVVDGVVTPIAGVVGPIASGVGNGLGGLGTIVQSLADPTIPPSPNFINQTNAPPGSTPKEARISSTSAWIGSPTAPAESSSLTTAGSTTSINSATTLEPGTLTASSTSGAAATSMAISVSQSQHGDPRTSVSQTLAALSATSQILSIATTADMSYSATMTALSEVPKLQATSKLEFSSGLAATRSEFQNSLIKAASAPTAALTAVTASVHVSDLVTSVSGHLTTIPIFSETVSTETMPPYTVVTTSGTTYTVSTEPSTTSISASTSGSPSAVDGVGTGTGNGGGQGTSSASSTSTPGVYDGMITLPNGVKVPLAAVVAPVVIGFALASALAVFCFWRRRKLREAIVDDDDRESLHPTSNTSSGFFSSRWSLSTFRDIEAASQRHSNYAESHNDHGPEDEEQSCLAPVERFVRHIFELDASEPPPQELEAVERAQELETAERPQELDVEDNDDLRGCAALIQRLLRQMLGQPTRQVRETLDMNLVEEIDFIEELRAHNEMRQTHYHEKSADLKSPAKAYLRQEHALTEEEIDPPPRYER